MPAELKFRAMKIRGLSGKEQLIESLASELHLLEQREVC